MSTSLVKDDSILFHQVFFFIYRKTPLAEFRRKDLLIAVTTNQSFQRRTSCWRLCKFCFEVFSTISLYFLFLLLSCNVLITRIFLNDNLKGQTKLSKKYEKRVMQDGGPSSVANRSHEQELRPKQNESVASHEFARRTGSASEETGVLDKTYFV